MKKMQELPAWRLLLGQLIHDPQERNRIANELGINPATLVRWAHNDTNPRPQNLNQLLQVVPPTNRQKLQESIAEEFPEFTSVINQEFTEDTSIEIPSGTYSSILHTYITTPKRQRFWLVSNLILQEALRQLDPNQLGMTVSVAQCVTPREGKKVRSLREHVERGTHPWKDTMKHEVAYLGIESLAGYALSNAHLLSIQDRSENLTFYPARWLDWEQSAAVCPIMREGRFAGCLIVSSSQPKYFLSYREALIQNYAELMVLAFESEEFYEPSDIQLAIMPEFNVQEQYFHTIRQRISRAMEDGSTRQPPVTISEAEELIWQQLEEEFVHLTQNQNVLNTLLP
jgi:transcriptional regulator with XRE-family HTH domain